MDIRDPHVFPYIVKGFNINLDSTVKFESRRTLVEAEQTSDRFKSEGLEVAIFEVRELQTA